MTDEQVAYALVRTMGYDNLTIGHFGADGWRVD